MIGLGARATRPSPRWTQDGRAARAPRSRAPRYTFTTAVQARIHRPRTTPVDTWAASCRAWPDEDRELALAMARAAQALEEAGISAQNLFDDLPAAGEEVMRRIYGDALVDDLLREHRAGVERGSP